MPTAHLLHVELPKPDAYLPSTQLMHVVDATAATESDAVPASQLKQADSEEAREVIE